MATWREARRGKYSVGFKKRVVAEALVPGASVAKIARAHGLNGNMIFGWRKDPRFQPTEKKHKAMEAALADSCSKPTAPAGDEPAFLPVEVEAAAAQAGLMEEAEPLPSERLVRLWLHHCRLWLPPTITSNVLHLLKVAKRHRHRAASSLF